MRKKILFVFNIYPGIGGLEAVSNNVISYLSDYFDIYTLSFKSQPNVDAPECVKEKYFFNPTATTVELIEKFNEVVSRENIEIVINQGMFPHVADVIFNDHRNENLKIFSFLHGEPNYEQQIYWSANTKRMKYLKRRLLCALGVNFNYGKYLRRFVDSYTLQCKGSSKVVMLCEPYIDYFVAHYGLEGYRGKVRSIENPLSKKFSEAPMVDWAEKQNEVLFVGRLSHEKRVDVLLDVWKNAALDDNWKLVIVGDGEDGVKLKEIVVDRSIQNVTFVGQTAEPEIYYERAKIVMLTSATEGFGMCLIEAQRFGVVPLVFDVSDGVRSIIEDGGGVLVGRNDRAAMVAKLRQMTSADSELNSLSEQARVKSEKYTIDRIGLRWIELLTEQPI